MHENCSIGEQFCTCFCSTYEQFLYLCGKYF
nr:MAG TPA: hypothetical protein [Caudoviricetes sp.]